MRSLTTTIFIVLLKNQSWTYQVFFKENLVPPLKTAFLQHEQLGHPAPKVLEVVAIPQQTIVRQCPPPTLNLFFFCSVKISMRYVETYLGQTAQLLRSEQGKD